MRNFIKAIDRKIEDFTESRWGVAYPDRISDYSAEELDVEAKERRIGLAKWAGVTAITGGLMAFGAIEHVERAVLVGAGVIEYGLAWGTVLSGAKLAIVNDEINTPLAPASSPTSLES